MAHANAPGGDKTPKWLPIDDAITARRTKQCAVANDLGWVESRLTAAKQRLQHEDVRIVLDYFHLELIPKGLKACDQRKVDAIVQAFRILAPALTVEHLKAED